MTDILNSPGEDGTSGGRRKFLKIVGGGVILAAAGGAGFLATRTPVQALAPWHETLAVDSSADPRKVVLSHAILAPNPHNRQPWMVDLIGDSQIDVYCDLERRLPHTDPYDRQITIGFGCFLELLDMTAAASGWATDIRLFPEGEGGARLDDRPIARIILKEDATRKPDPLFSQIFKRRSNKDVYETGKPVSDENAQAVASVGKFSTDCSHLVEIPAVERLRDITWQAMDMELRTYRTAKESVDLMRVGKAEIEANPDGIDLGGAFFETLDLIGQLNPEDMLDPDSLMFDQSVAALRPPILSAQGYVFVKTQGNTRKDQIAAGRDYVRMNLKATELGISMRPLSQALQEYEEVSQYYDAVRKELGIEANETLQMLACIGYGAQPDPSPRWRFETRIRKEA